MRTGWVDKIGPYKVERIAGVIRTNASVDLSKPPTCGWHRTEGSWAGSIGVYRSKLATPTFQIDEGRIGQCIPLGEMAAAFKNPPGGVETNRWCRVQIEVVGFSKEEPYIFPPKLLDVAAHLAAWLEDNCGIPMSRPWPGADLGPQPWATTSYKRRQAGKWGKVAGWYGHVEIPENDHWDPGELDYPKLLTAAKALNRPPTLRLTTPFMRGDDVVAAKKLLQNNAYGNFVVGNTDNIWGMEAAQATWRAKHYLGYPRKEMNLNFGPTVRKYLAGELRLPVGYRVRRTRRLARHGFRVPVFTPSREIHLDSEEN